MRAEELDNLTEKELQDKANESFIAGENTNIHLHGGEEERLRLQLEAQFYLTLVARKRDERVARRDFWMEVAVIVLIGLEIILGVYGLKEGTRQARVLEHMDQSTAATANTLRDLQKAQSDSLRAQKDSLFAINKLNGKLTNQTGLLSDAEKSLQAQLGLAERQFEAQNRHPVLQVRALLVNLTTSARTTQVLEPRKVTEINLLSEPDDHFADFVLRNTGTADAAHIELRAQPSSGVTVKCIDYGLLGGCDAQSAVALTLPPRPKDRPEVSNPSQFVPDIDGMFDLLVEVRLDVPKGIRAFGLTFSVGAEGINPTRYDLVCDNPAP